MNADPINARSFDLPLTDAVAQESRGQLSLFDERNLYGELAKEAVQALMLNCNVISSEQLRYGAAKDSLDILKAALPRSRAIVQKSSS